MASRKRQRAPASAEGRQDREQRRSQRRPADIAGLPARRYAAVLLDGVLVQRHTLEETLDRIDRSGAFGDLAPRDRAFARLVAATVLRRHGSLSLVVRGFMDHPLPPAAVGAELILLAAAAQLMLLATPPHAVINLAVEQCRADRRLARFAGLANAVLRRVAVDGAARLASLDCPRVDLPDWLWQRWVANFGPDAPAAIAAASLAEAPLDLAVKRDPEHWARLLGGTVLSTGGVRLAAHGRIEDLPGYADGEWWVQDAAATLPARLLGDVAGKRVADLCAAPGGKTAALAAAGATVVAVDRSAARLQRLTVNMQRLGFSRQVSTIAADLRTWVPEEPFDAILLDAPCTATGTIRRHPDILHLKRPGDAAELARLQVELLHRAAAWVRPGGHIVVCTCSLEPEEGPALIPPFLAAHADFARHPVAPSEIFGHADWLTAEGDLRTRPDHVPGAATDPHGHGMDGFFASRLRRRAG